MPHIKRILLLNPPGSKMFFRDYYCAKVSKARYYYHPVDLVYLSGRLSKIGDVFVIDAIAEKKDISSTLHTVIELHPDIILFLSSAPSFIEDMHFLKAVNNELPEIKMIGTGDIFRDMRGEALNKYPFLDALLLDFSTSDIIKYLQFQEGVIPNVIYRKNGVVIDGKENHHNGNFDVPLPRWDLFNLKAYQFPFSKRKPFASILTDFGCPFACDFCPISSLGFKLRSIDAVIDEMKSLQKLGIKELYIRDQTFGANKKRTMELLNSMLDNKLNFTWTCLTRTDIPDLEMLSLMKKSGCHTIMLGIESASQEIINTHKKRTQTIFTFEIIKRIKNAGIRVGGFFMIGFPGESRESIQATINLACKLPIDYASFNIASPRSGTDFRKNAINTGAVDAEVFDSESSFSMPVWKNQIVSNNDLIALKKHAVRKFYMRPMFLLKRLFAIKTLTEASNLFGEALELFIKNK